jgi:hypothetical protein
VICVSALSIPDDVYFFGSPFGVESKAVPGDAPFLIPGEDSGPPDVYAFAVVFRARRAQRRRTGPSVIPDALPWVGDTGPGIDPEGLRIGAGDHGAIFRHFGLV